VVRYSRASENSSCKRASVTSAIGVVLSDGV
jgi:hypothetical protein